MKIKALTAQGIYHITETARDLFKLTHHCAQTQIIRGEPALFEFLQTTDEELHLKDPHNPDLFYIVRPEVRHQKAGYRVTPYLHHNWTEYYYFFPTLTEIFTALLKSDEAAFDTANSNF